MFFFQFNETNFILFSIKNDLGMGCKGKETLQFLCEQIPGDALLYSMFKINAEPVKCPLKGNNLF